MFRVKKSSAPNSGISERTKTKPPSEDRFCVAGIHSLRSLATFVPNGSEKSVSPIREPSGFNA